jgi:dihydroneopterin aldolase
VTDTIAIRGLRVRGRHGVFPAEREQGQLFIVDAWLEIDPVSDDSLTATVDYGELATRLEAIVAGEPVQLLETLADRLAAVCLADARVHAVKVRVHKPQAPVSVEVDDVSVTVRRARG